MEIIQIILSVITLVVLIWYAWSTEQMKNQSIRQTEILQMPIMALFIRDLKKFKEENAIRKVKDGGYRVLLRTEGETDYVFRLRNVGQGPALNVEVLNDKFKIAKYETNFFAPLKDEHSIKIIMKPDNKIENLDDLNDQIFEIRCKGISGNQYSFKYKITEFKKESVEYIG